MIKREYLLPKKGMADDDILLFLVDMTNLKKIKTNRLMQLVLFVPTVWMIIVSSLGLYSLSTNWKETTMYIPNLALIIQSNSITIFLWIYKDLILSVIDSISINFWSLKSAGEELFEELKEDCKRIKMISYLIILLTICSTITESAFMGDEIKWQFTIKTIEDHFTGWNQKVIFWMNESVCLIWGYTTAIPLLIITYLINHMKFQIRILNKYLEMLQTQDGEMEDKDYQEWISNHLKLCIKIHVNIIRSSSILMKYFPFCTVAILTVALVSFVSPAYFIIAKISPISNFRMYIILITCIIQECVACIYCQHMTDESVNIFYQAQNCNWVNWEKRNKKALLILLIYSKEPWQTAEYGVPSGSYELILKLWRTCYATLTLFMNTSGNKLKI